MASSDKNEIETAMKSFRLLVGAVIVALACTSSSGSDKEYQDSPFALVDTVSMDVVLTLDTLTYAAGSVATVAVENNTDHEIAYHLGCQTRVEGDDGNKWVHVFQLDCSNIRVRPTRLAPGESAEERYAMPTMEQLGPLDCAQYRLRLTVEGDSYFSEPFEISTDD